MAIWSNLAGTVLGYIRLGLTGVRIKNSAGELAVRDAGDTADAKVQIADGTAANHAVTKGQLDGKQPLDATLTAIADESLGAFSHRNKIINGNFDIWQRGTSQTTSDYGSDDRWFNQNNGTTKTHSRQAFALGQTAVPGEPAYYSSTAVTSVAGAANYCLKIQRIEGVRLLAGKTATVSFYAKADAAKNIAIAFVQNFGTGGTPSAAVTAIGSQLVALTTTWQKFTKTISIPSISGKTLGTAGDDFTACQFWFDAGTDNDTQAASLGQQSGTFDIAQVQIEEGSVATPFEQRPIGVELALCQRYYEKSYAHGTAPATATTTDMVQEWVVPGAGNYQSSGVRFTQEKRALPTITIYSSATGASGVAAAVVAAADKTVTLEGTGTKGTAPYFGLAASDLMRYHWTASAEL